VCYYTYLYVLSTREVFLHVLDTLDSCSQAPVSCNGGMHLSTYTVTATSKD
jgi:hypothetical protein